MSVIQRSLPRLLRQLWRHIGARRRKQFVLLTGLMLVSAFAEVLSLGAVVPFLGIIMAPAVVMKYPIVASQMKAWGLTAADQLVLPLTLGFVLAALAAGAFRILLLWASTRAAFAAGSDLSVELYRRTLYQPYSVHVDQNTSTVFSGIGKVNGAINVLTQCLLLVSATVLLVTITLALVAISPVVSSVSIIGCGLCYAVITGVVRRRLRLNSACIAEEQTQVIKTMQEGLGGIRDVLLGGTQPVYIEQYRKADVPLRRGLGSNLVIAGSPRYAMEAAGMALIAAIAYVLSLKTAGIAADIPVLGALALGAQRLLPTLQQGYSSWATIVGSQAVLEDTIELLDQPLPGDVFEPDPKPLPFNESIRFENVRFQYSSDAPPVLDNFSLHIPKGARVGLVGTSGSGKSTALDIMMGLLDPTAGELLVDNLPISGSRRKAWQRSIGHVPQSIFLADATIAENIAFGVSHDDIDLERVRESARQAQLADFVEARSEGYQARVGERGIQLSGGQRQRIGIARALYKRASVLVFDEATSSLDNVTEQSLMDSIGALGRDLTILMIAHRLTTVRRCEIIVELRSGRIVAQGTFKELLEFSPSFRQMAAN